MNVTLPVQQFAKTAVAPRFSADQVDLIKRTICKNATDDELKLFMHQCERTGLDPFARQIYSIERREQRDGRWITTRAIQVSIDGFRLVAERSGKYVGQLGPYWCGNDGQWQDVWLSSEPPVAARVGILREDFKEPCWGVARYDAYAQKRDGKPTRMWAVMGDVMIAKCAEALGLRKAFPQELSGLYTSEEMDQTTSPDDTPPVQKVIAPEPPAPPPPEPPVHPETGEIGPHTIPYDGKNAIPWGSQYVAALKSTELVTDLIEWADANESTLAMIEEEAPKVSARIKAAFNVRMKELDNSLHATE